jgi:hypothetical protein
MRKGAVYNDAFLICHEIYQAARELVNSRVPTTQLTSASKFLWRPDLRPRLVEYVADFARCGDRALGDKSDSRTPKAPLRAKVYQQDELSRVKKAHAAFGVKEVPRLGALTSRRAKPLRASRLILFRVYYLGGAEYEAARHVMGLSERTWSDWAEEVRARVGSELIRSGMYPPARYFRQPSARPASSGVEKGTAEASRDCVRDAT